MIIQKKLQYLECNHLSPWMNPLVFFPQLFDDSVCEQFSLCVISLPLMWRTSSVCDNSHRRPHHSLWDWTENKRNVDGERCVRHKAETANLETRQPHLLFHVCIVLRVQVYPRCLESLSQTAGFTSVRQLSEVWKKQPWWCHQSCLSLGLGLFNRKLSLQTGGVGFERSGCLGDR